MNNPLVSIIIPVYNRENIIAETINCATNQTYNNLEIIISDNCSTDNTWFVLQEIAKKDLRIKIFRNEKNLGPVLNWKCCIDKINGEFTKILWSDDLIALDFIEKTIKVFNPDTAFVMSGIKVFGKDLSDIRSISKFQFKVEYLIDDYLKDILVYNKYEFSLSPCCAIFRSKDILESYIDEIPNFENLSFKKFGAGNDLLFFLLSTLKYDNIKCIPEFLTFYRSHDTSLSISNKLDLYYEYARLFFISKHCTKIYKIFKVRLFIKALRFKEYRVIFKKSKLKLF